MTFDALFGTSARHFGALHIFFVPLACVTHDLAQGAAQKNPC